MTAETSLTQHDAVVTRLRHFLDALASAAPDEQSGERLRHDLARWTEDLRRFAVPESRRHYGRSPTLASAGQAPLVRRRRGDTPGATRRPGVLRHLLPRRPWCRPRGHDPAALRRVVRLAGQLRGHAAVAHGVPHDELPCRRRHQPTADLHRMDRPGRGPQAVPACRAPRRGHRVRRGRRTFRHAASGSALTIGRYAGAARPAGCRHRSCPRWTGNSGGQGQPDWRGRDLASPVRCCPGDLWSCPGDGAVPQSTPPLPLRVRPSRPRTGHPGPAPTIAQQPSKDEALGGDQGPDRNASTAISLAGDSTDRTGEHLRPRSALRTFSAGGRRPAGSAARGRPYCRPESRSAPVAAGRWPVSARRAGPAPPGPVPGSPRR